MQQNLVLSKKLNRKKSFNILIVDDDITASELFKQILESRGHNVSVFNEGISCLNACQTTTYDIIFMDYHIDDINGVDVTELIKDVFHMNTTIFAYTGDTSTDALKKFKQIGMTGAIIKPISIDAIEQLMTSFEQRECIDKLVIEKLARRFRESLMIFR